MSECDELGLEFGAKCKAALEDVGYNADLYIAIQEDNTKIRSQEGRSLCNVYDSNSISY